MMKKSILVSILCLLIIIVFSNGNAYASRKLNSTVLKVGFYNPKDVNSGLVFGFNHGYIIDETVDIGFGADFFYKSYQKETEIATSVSEGSVVSTTKRKDVEFNTFILPIMANMNIKIPISQQTPAFFVLNGGIGWELMFNSEQNFVEDKKESRFYHGFGYQVNAGVMYQIGSRSALLAELGYNGCKVSSNHKKVEGAPVWDEVNISGVLLRFGVRIGIL